MDVHVADPVTLVAHEIRRPLAYVVTAARLVAEESDDETVQQRCRTIERTAERMLRVAGCLLRTGSAVQGESVSAAYLPAQVIRGVVEDLTQQAAVDLVVEPVAWSACAWGRADDLEALVHSLVSNALDHGVPGDPPLVSVAASNSLLEISISNRMAPATTHKGLGLGMLICERLAARCGAELAAGARDGVYTATLSLGLLRPVRGERIQLLGQWRLSGHPIRAAATSA